MPDFKELRDQLQQSRQHKQQTRAGLFAAREQVKKIEAEQARQQRTFNPDDPAHQERRQQLEQLKAEAAATAKHHEGIYRQTLAAEHGLFLDFAQFSDPRQQINRLNDDFPFLLLPIRIETRFKTLNVAGAVRRQLWVRIYPDDCAIDSFETTLSESEVRGAQLYWIEIWKAGGIEEQERGAWRGLVANFGSGRAAWISGQYQPVNLATKPTKAKGEDIILVIPTETPLTDDEVKVARIYWETVWLADDDQKKEDDAREALEFAVGDARAAEIIEQYRPANLSAKPASPLSKADVTVSVEFLILPKSDDLATKQLSWTQPPQINVLPDRFVLIGYRGGNKEFEVVGNPIRSPLAVGPDPSAAPDEQLRQEKGEIVVSEEMRWMVDFDRAVEWGMGFRVDLNEVQAREGFDRLLALGVRLSTDETESKKLLEGLIDNHYHGRNGFSLLPQGTPTNNTESGNIESGGAGFSRSEDPDDSFDYFFKGQAQFEVTSDWFKKRDGQWLAEYLGIDYDVLQKLSHAEDKDQCEARAMNVALWPATLGYWMETMMHPVFDDDDIEAVRWYFTHFVSGRGAVPAIRIGSQPYGILLTTAFSRVRWIEPRGLRTIPGIESPRRTAELLMRLQNILQRIDADWRELAEDVSFVGKAGDAHKTLLDIVGLHSGSVEYHQRYAESLQHLFNRLNLEGFGGAFIAALIAAGYIESGMQLLRELDGPRVERPDILEKFFLSGQNLLRGPVVDIDPPLSETEPIRSYTDDGRNYIKWLIDAAKTSLETLRQQSGFTGNKRPNALLYLMLRHALIEGYWDADLRLRQSAGIFTDEAVKAARREQPFMHVQGNVAASESRWQHLYRPEPLITNHQSQPVYEFIPGIIGKTLAARYLDQQLKALEHLQDAPTARLERVFAEHIDCCSYRLDAWQAGLLNYQLAAMRYQREEDEVVARKGVYLGAYGWLEEVRPENKPLTPIRLDPELDKVFNKNPTDPPLLRDNSNGGYIHAPSLNHAVTAAVLRNGYLSNATPANPQTLAVNLSSERVRLALGILEGIRGGQSLGALLGYQFERGLHDRHDLPAGPEVDEFIFDIRKQFPLRAKRFTTTKDDDAAIEALEARNVMDGLALVNHIKQTGNKNYPFGKPLPAASPTQAAALNAEVERLLDVHDAVADLALAEGVHQAVQGNFDRVAATLDTYSKGNFPPEPDVVRTPRTGTTLTHRVGLQLEAGLDLLDPTVSAPGVAMTPRANAEPALNKWLASLLPAPANAGCKVKFFDPVTNDAVEEVVTQLQLQLQPIDLLYLLRTDSQQAMTELDDRVLKYVIETFAPRPDRAITIHYTDRLTGKISFFELAALIAHLRALVLRARPLRATDIALSDEAGEKQDASVFVDKARIVAVKSSLDALHPQLVAFHTPLDALLADVPTNRATIIANVDSYVDQITALLATAGLHAIPQTGWGFAFALKRQAFSSVLQKVDELVERWDDRLAEYDQLIGAYNALPPATGAQQKFDLLQKAERLISTEAITPLPATPDLLKAELDLKRVAFETRLGQFKAILDTATTQLAGLLAAVELLLDVAAFDPEGIKLDEIEQQILIFAADAASIAKSLANDIDRRSKAAQEQLDIHDAAAQAQARAQALQTAAKILLGDDFQIIPEFALTTEQGDEWEKAVAAGSDLLHYLTNDLKNDFPVDDWLYGVARVREKMRHWEQTVIFVEAFGNTERVLTPIQLPFKEQDRWLALQFPSDYKLDSERLLYTAHYVAPFQKTARQCGLLLDEWTEVIPAREETTGIAFHYDRPNSEPPQVMLLVTPPDFTGEWQWADLVDALNETLDWAKRRAVEPVQVDKTAYARFLPATITAVTVYPISIALTYAANNNVFQFLSGQNDG